MDKIISMSFAGKARCGGSAGRLFMSIHSCKDEYCPHEILKYAAKNFLESKLATNEVASGSKLSKTA